MADDKYAKSKCFVFSKDGYEEITYSELCLRKDTDIRYQEKKFVPLHEMLMEVTAIKIKTISMVQLPPPKSPKNLFHVPLTKDKNPKVTIVGDTFGFCLFI